MANETALPFVNVKHKSIIQNDVQINVEKLVHLLELCTTGNSCAAWKRKDPPSICQVNELTVKIYWAIISYISVSGYA
jgi:hypothetical protein